MLDHPEYAGKVIEYFDTGCNQDDSSGSMHGAAVLSLLVGETIGTAPDAKVYYAAAPAWEEDAKYFADGLRWIIEKNASLSEGEKIRVVSVSAAPLSSDGSFINGELWTEAVADAVKAGIMVIDCTEGSSGFVYPMTYDPSDRESPEKCIVEFGAGTKIKIPFNQIGAIANCRTVAEEYRTGEYHYAYCGSSGLSWAIPYVSGVLAMGWQVRPELDAATMRSLLYKSAAKSVYNSNVIDPAAFIEAVKNYKA